jgi:AcrR family transcriptional regulator
MARAYNKTKRASKEEETRQRILGGAFELYCSVGPAATTISAVAAKASVQRLTVYRHFPNEADLLCGVIERWADENPMPGPQDWRTDIDAENWPIAILSMLYSYYSETSVLWPGILSDRTKLPELDRLMGQYDQQLETLKADILRHLPEARQRSALCQSVVSHAVQFTTWHSLSASGLDTAEIAALMEDWVQKCPLG